MNERPNDEPRGRVPCGAVPRQGEWPRRGRYALEYFAAQLVQDARSAITHREAVRLVEERAARDALVRPHDPPGAGVIGNPQGEERGSPGCGDGAPVEGNGTGADPHAPCSQEARDPGPGAQKVRTPAEASAAEWPALARGLAEEAHENHIRSRRGIWYLTDRQVLVVYNNDPCALRHQELAAFRHRLATEGIRELAFATYPLGSPAGRGSFALVLGARADRMELVARFYEESIDEARARHAEPAAGRLEGGGQCSRSS